MDMIRQEENRKLIKNNSERLIVSIDQLIVNRSLLRGQYI